MNLCRRSVPSRAQLSIGGPMPSARAASPCFPRPRSELGLSSRVPQISVKRARLGHRIRVALDQPSRRTQLFITISASYQAVRATLCVTTLSTQRSRPCCIEESFFDTAAAKCFDRSPLCSCHGNARLVGRISMRPAVAARA